MRRKDREVTSLTEIRQIIDLCKVCRIGMVDEQGIYVVPVNFGYEFVGDKLRIYVHGAGEGRKLSAVRENPAVCVEMDGEHRLVEADEACRYSYGFSSLIGNGQAVIVDEVEEKKRGLSLIMKHQTGKDFLFDDRKAKMVTVVRIDLDRFSGKRKVVVD